MRLRRSDRAVAPSPSAGFRQHEVLGELQPYPARHSIALVDDVTIARDPFTPAMALLEVLQCLLYALNIEYAL